LGFEKKSIYSWQSGFLSRSLNAEIFQVTGSQDEAFLSSANSKSGKPITDMFFPYRRFSNIYLFKD